tara:strand:- start:14 stop:1240 length:1227 start_codon:yes stop_codon:yes gene_type:complete
MSNLNFFRVMQSSNYSPSSIPCNSSGVSFSGKSGSYYATAVVLGTGIGPVTASFNSINIPDRFQLEWSGSIVADSLFVGDNLKTSSSYSAFNATASAVSSLVRYDYYFTNNSWTTGSAEGVSFNSASLPPQSNYNGAFRRGNSQDYNVNGKGNWGAQKGVLDDFPSSLDSCVDGNVKLCFYKSSTFPTSFNIISTGITPGTVWNLLDISCPSGTSLNSSSIMDLTGSIALVYHTAPTFDLSAGMTLYKDSALTIPFGTGQSWSSGSYWGNATGSLLISGSTSDPTGTGALGDTCFKNTIGSGTGYPFLWIQDNGVIVSKTCTATILRPLKGFSSSGGTVFSGVCALSINRTYYHNGSGTYPAYGDIVYQDSNGLSVVADFYYKFNLTWVYKIVNGEVAFDWPQNICGP